MKQDFNQLKKKLLDINIYPTVKLSALPATPLVSVLITNYNYGKLIGEAINSVLNQTYQNFEIIICDDGSTDDSIEIINEFIKIENRIKLIAKQNGGQASALNAAFSASRGDIISVLDADDIFMPNKLELVVRSFANSGCGIVLHFLTTVDSHGNIIWSNNGDFKQGWIAKSILLVDQMRIQFGSSINLRREVADKCFPLPDKFRCDADRVLGNRALLISELNTIPLDLAVFRIHSSNITSKSMMELQDELDKLSARIRMVNEDMISFFETHHNIKINSELRDYIHHKSIAVSVLTHNLVNRKPLPFDYIQLVDDSLTRAIYYALFLIPRGLAIKILKWWRSTSKLKEVIRRAYRILRRRTRVSSDALH